MLDLDKSISGYQELKSILSDMKKNKCQIIEMRYELLLQLLIEMHSLKKQKNVLIDSYDKLKAEVMSKQPNELDQESKQFLFIIKLLRELKSRGLWIEYKNKTVHTNEYYRIEKETLDMIVEEKASGEIDPKKILDMMANMGIIRKQADGKILSSASVGGVSKRIYMVRIDSVDYLE